MKFPFFRKKHSDNPLIFFIQNHFGFTPKNIDLFVQAFRHKSAVKKEDRGILGSNERLEFLGDSVISSIVSEYLFEKYPNKDEGFLTQLRAKIVSRDSLNNLGAGLNLEDHIDYFRGNSAYNSLLGNVFEAIFGAIYLDQGYQKTKIILVQQILEKRIDLDKLQHKTTDFKSKLLMYCQKNQLNLTYKQLDEINIDGFIKFKMGVYIDDENIAEAIASSKRKAEHRAAEMALSKLPKSS